MHPLYGALSVPFVPVLVTRYMLWSLIGIRMRLPAAEPSSTSVLLFPSQYLRGTILVTLLFDRVELAGFKSRAFIGIIAAWFFTSCAFPRTSSLLYGLPWVGIVGLGSSDCCGVNRPLSVTEAFHNNNNNNNNNNNKNKRS